MAIVNKAGQDSLDHWVSFPARTVLELCAPVSHIILSLCCAVSSEVTESCAYISEGRAGQFAFSLLPLNTFLFLPPCPQL